MPEVVNPYSDLVNLMRKQGAVYNPPAVQLAKVLTPPPNLTIQTGDIQIDKDNILIADYLLADYKRAYHMEGKLHLSASDTNAEDNLSGATNIKAHSHTVSGSSPEGSVTGTAASVDHDHTIKNITINTEDFNAHGDGKDPIVNDKTAPDTYFAFKDTLKKGDIVAVMPTEDRQTYIILSRLVRADYKF